jgi:urease accessory protein
LLSGLPAGFLNPLLVPAHAVALLGLGLMIGQQSRRGVTMTAFALGLIVGLAAITAAVGETSANTVLLAATAFAGLTVAIGSPIPAVVGAPLALVIGASIALDSPPKAVSLQAANAALVGTAVGAGIIVGLVAAIVMQLRRGWPRIGVRVLGSWIAASAVLVLALRLAR